MFTNLSIFYVNHDLEKSRSIFWSNGKLLPNLCFSLACCAWSRRVSFLFGRLLLEYYVFKQSLIFFNLIRFHLPWKPYNQIFWNWDSSNHNVILSLGPCCGEEFYICFKTRSWQSSLKFSGCLGRSLLHLPTSICRRSSRLNWDRRRKCSRKRFACQGQPSWWF